MGPVGDFLEYYTPGKLANIAVAGKWGPRIEDVWILLKMEIFQPAMLVYQRVMISAMLFHYEIKRFLSPDSHL